ncbi:hypothetical protein EMIHUDRAFT_218762 [Emiliania huxleyi CCMP1516]|uniref:EF-hand domain-containing protein n=2 Tax=Emiliania huxleyi TaxID=2903 RepID=A0A0D3I6X1_EMIH1|nr:hypothetical protein EMIHUDRAFT_218762 [Emiliania huxleyi CCMP1516]EOD07006.1 hypothetical protein EMIHUDRAFT_218762 [Emiliania huxleyi CCMP1516]|eukprot:XP_005759435.1 hypothetical protein EMIHUDRAFT_218762 [Emiliania huxleyi CCMP1516]
MTRHVTAQSPKRNTKQSAKALRTIKAVFMKLDKDGSGSLDKSELKEVVEMYSGEAFDVEQFFEWYDTHGKADSTVDLTEFGWYLADVALSFPDAKAAMPAVIQEKGGVEP